MNSNSQGSVAGPVRTQMAPNPVGMPTAKDIAAKLKDSENIMDFIKANSTIPGGTPEEIKPEEIIQEVEASIAKEEASKVTDPPKDVTNVLPETTPENKPALPDTEAPTPKEAKPSDVAVDEIDVPDVPVAENFKRLRTKLKETSKTLKGFQEEKAKLEKEIESYKTGKVVPEALQGMEDRVKELEHFERIHSLKTSRAYQEQYIKPLSELKTKLGALAADYDIPPEYMNDALNITNKADLNRFLSQHFDDVGALEVKQLITQAKELQGKAVEAEKEPAQALARLEEENQNRMAFEDSQRLESISSSSKHAFTEALGAIKQEGKYHELIIDPEDAEHNETYVKPLISAASKEFGKLVTVLANSGLKTLNHEAAYALAMSVLRAHASAVSVQTREAAARYAHEIENNTRRTSSMVRPAIGSTVGSSGSGDVEPKKPDSLKEAIANQLNTVLAKKR